MSYISAAQAKQIAQKIKENLDTKADVTGIYDDFIAGLAKNLLSKVSQQDVDAYLYRPSGGSLEIGDTCRVKSIVGGSLGFNQLIQNGNFESMNNWAAFNHTLCSLSVSDNKAIMSVVGTAIYGYQQGLKQDIQKSIKILGHKYLGVATVTSTTSSKFTVNIFDQTSTAGNEVLANSRTTVWAFLDYSSASSYDTVVVQPITGRLLPEGESYTVENVILTDLTATFGSTIADYVYNLEQATVGAGVAWFRRYFPKPYYPHTPVGGFIHVKTSGKKVVGFNQWNGTYYGSTVTFENEVLTNNIADSLTFLRVAIQVYTENDTYVRNLTFETSVKNGRTCYVFNVGGINPTDYIIVKHNGRSKDIGLIKINNIIPNNTYCLSWEITANNPSVVGGLRLKQPNLNFHYDGERDGEYEEYEEETYPCDPIDLIGIPHIDGQGNLYFEGDKYNSDGTVDNEYVAKRFTGEENGWTQRTTDGHTHTFTLYFVNLPDNERPKNGVWYATTWVNGWTPLSASNLYDTEGVYLASTNALYVTVPSANSLTDFQEYLASHPLMLIYPKANTQSSATPFTEIQKVWNWGTEQYLPPENDTRPVEVPVGHDTDYLLDIRSKVEIMPDLPVNDGKYVVDVTSGTARYIPLNVYLQTNGYKPSVIPNPPTADGTYDLALTIADGAPTYSWVART